MYSFLKGRAYERRVHGHLLASQAYRRLHPWSSVPEDVLLASGIVDDRQVLRQRRKGATRDAVNPLPDTGVDLVGERFDGRYDLVQAKTYNRSVGINDLAGIYGSLLPAMLEERVDGVIAHSSSLTQNARDVMARCRGRLREVYIPYEEDDGEDTTTSTQALPTLWPEQEEAVAAVKYNWFSPDAYARGILDAPCGIGKTIITVYTIKELAAASAVDHVVVACPQRQHAMQFVKDVRRADLDGWDVVLVDCDGTRDAEKLAEQAKLRSTVFVSTYKSMDVIADLLPTVFKGKKWLMVVDEFHNLTARDVGLVKTDGEDQGSAGTPFWRVFSSEDAAPHRVIGVSATPRVYDAEGLDDDGLFFRDTVYKMSWQEAFDKKRIADFEIVVPSISENIGDAMDAQAREVGIDEVERPLQLECGFTLKAMLDRGKRRAIVFMPSGPGMRADETAIAYADMLRRLADGFYGVDVVVESILGDDSATARADRLWDFQEGPDTRIVVDKDGEQVLRPVLHILLAVRILDEGVDVPACDSVFFARGTTSSKLRCVQRMCRALRLSHPGKVATIGICADSYEDLGEFFSALKEVDPAFVSKVRVVSCDYDQKSSTSAGVQATLQADQEALDRFVVGVRVYKAGGEAAAVLKMEKLVAWSRENGNRVPRRCRVRDPTEAQRLENCMADLFGNWKAIATGKRDRVLWPAVDAGLKAHWGEQWSAKHNLEAEALEKLAELEAWMAAHDGRWPRMLSAKKRADATPERLAEYRLSQYIQYWRQAANGKGTLKLYDSLAAGLVELLGPDWSTVNRQKQDAIAAAHAVVAWARQNDNRLPRQMSSAKARAAASEERQMEGQLAKYVAKWKQAAEGRGSVVLYQEVDEILCSKWPTWKEPQKRGRRGPC
jgi:superfamily II DNA or RNA helicase